MISTPIIKKRNINICGTISVCAMTRKECVDQILDLLVEPMSSTVDFVGVPALVSANQNAEIKKMYSESTLAVIDGMPLVKTARKLGIDCERCSGPDIMGMVFDESQKKGMTHYFYGGNNDEALKKLRDKLEEKYPGIRIAGMYSPPFRPLTVEEDDAICREINEVKPDFLWVGIGAPKQELWMWKHQDKIHGTRMLGVGAAFNFFAGTLERAPSWVENAGFEWLYRLIKEPKRLWRRYVLGGVKYTWLSLRKPSKLLDE